MARSEHSRAAAGDPLGLGRLPVRDLPPRADVARAAAICFRDRDGELLLDYLRALTLGRTLGPGADDSLLRHLEGQRQLVVHLIQLIDAGRHAPAAASPAPEET